MAIEFRGSSDMALERMLQTPVASRGTPAWSPSPHGELGDLQATLERLTRRSKASATPLSKTTSFQPSPSPLGQGCPATGGECNKMDSLRSLLFPDNAVPPSPHPRRRRRHTVGQGPGSSLHAPGNSPSKLHALRPASQIDNPTTGRNRGAATRSSWQFKGGSSSEGLSGGWRSHGSASSSALNAAGSPVHRDSADWSTGGLTKLPFGASSSSSATQLRSTTRARGEQNGVQNVRRRMRSGSFRGRAALGNSPDTKEDGCHTAEADARAAMRAHIQKAKAFLAASQPRMQLLEQELEACDEKRDAAYAQLSDCKDMLRSTGYRLEHRAEQLAACQTSTAAVFGRAQTVQKDALDAGRRVFLMSMSMQRERDAHAELDAELASELAANREKNAGQSSS
eukprot:TRINITY_DN31809_c0_g1_i1.p1 TRINITY_DN31809_c0_g1~~TRINITY_DN31809_c0_g1_i1.p1  ORF type:complete len:397 (+),score=69.71 TRINITY_DN31809_c0_g1_i1:132-1322(+)